MGSIWMSCCRIKVFTTGVMAFVLLLLSNVVDAADYAVVSVVQPAPESEFSATESIDFVGRAFIAREDGTRKVIPGDQMQWTSSVDGIIGIGSSFKVLLSGGEHTIFLSVMDTEGSSTTESTIIFVLE